MSQMINSNEYIRKLSISHVELRSLRFVEHKTQKTFAESFIPFVPIILVSVPPEKVRRMSWVGIFTLKFRKQVIELFGVLMRVVFEFPTMEPYVGIADKVIIRLVWITGRVSGR